MPKTEKDREHDLKPNEIVTEVVVPPAEGARCAHYEIRQKAAFDWPFALAAVALKMEGSNVGAARSSSAMLLPRPGFRRKPEARPERSARE